MTRKQKFILKVLAHGIYDTREYRYYVRMTPYNGAIYRIRRWKLDTVEACYICNWDLFYELKD